MRNSISRGARQLQGMRNATRCSRIVSTVANLVIAASLVASYTSIVNMATKPTASSLDSVVSKQTEFALSFYRSLTSGANDLTNNIISPLSLSLALSLVSGGAKGRTLDEILSALNLSPGTDHHSAFGQLQKNLLEDSSGGAGPVVKLANRCYVEDSLKLANEFNALAEQHYGSTVASCNFINKSEEARKSINAWVEEETGGKVSELLPDGSVDAASRLVIANALYFKGTWEKKFDISATKDGPFVVNGKSSVNVPLMHSQGQYLLKEFPSYKCLKLPYTSSADSRKLALFVLLPNSADGLPDLEAQLSADVLMKDLETFNKTKLVRVVLPRFRISFGVEASTPLQALGMKSAFTTQADLSGLVQGAEGKGLFISNIFHQAVIEVNEEGAEAAAATAAVIKYRSLTFPEKFEATHPFVFLLRDDTSKAILFLGKVADPSKS